MRSLLRGAGRRVRLAAVVALVGMTAAGALIGGSSTASARATGTVSYTGGCSLISGTVTADPKRIEIAAGKSVEFANRLGHKAVLRLDGEEVAEVPTGSAVEITFHDGPVTATMQIDCLTGKASGAAVVDVRAATQPPPPAPPAPTSPATGASGGSGSSSGGAAGPAPGGSSPADPTGGWPVPAGPGGSSGPAGTGVWPGGHSPVTAAPGSPLERDGAGEIGGRRPAGGGAAPGSPANVDEQAVDDSVAAEQLSRTAAAASGGEPIGLLALIATVCVVGVSAGAVRTILTHRSNQAEAA